MVRTLLPMEDSSRQLLALSLQAFMRIAVRGCIAQYCMVLI